MTAPWMRLWPCLLATLVIAQTPSGKALAFEVATVKVNRSGKDWPAIHPEPGRVIATNMTLKSLLAAAYLLREDLISGGPGWLDTERYDINAKCENVSSQDQQRQMLRTLLLERFQLQLREVARDVPEYELVVAKNGPKLRLAKPGEASFRRFGKGRLGLQSGTMADLARLLETVVRRTVVDRTGLTGNYDVELLYTPEGYQPKPDGADGGSNHEPPPPDPNGPSLFLALQEQLGLRLESKKGPGEILVIERASKPREN